MQRGGPFSTEACATLRGSARGLCKWSHFLDAARRVRRMHTGCQYFLAFPRPLRRKKAWSPKNTDFMIDLAKLRTTCIGSIAWYLPSSVYRGSDRVGFGAWLSRDVTVLARCRSREGKTTMAHMHSFTLFTRDNKAL